MWSESSSCWLENSIRVSSKFQTYLYFGMFSFSSKHFQASQIFWGLFRQFVNLQFLLHSNTHLNSRGDSPFKGTVAWDFWSLVFHQTTPPGPIRDILEPFSFLSNFHGVMYILKRLPGVRNTGSHKRNNKVKKILKTWSKSSGIVDIRSTLYFGWLLL